MRKNTNYKRKQFELLMKRVLSPRKLIQVICGPRQTGKTTLAKQLIDAAKIPTHYVSADESVVRGVSWIEQHWETARMQAKKSNARGGLIILDEIQKIPSWSETVKRLWDADTFSRLPLKVIILGSSPLLLQKGLSESLAGRFEVVPVTHWSYSEMKKAFGWNVDQYIYFGGYPGSSHLIDDSDRWARYITDSLIETTISRDILLMTRVDKPSLLRQLFYLGSDYSGQVVSYQKLVGQLQDAGNTTTLAHYLNLLSAAGMVAGLQKYSEKKIRQRSSSPKLIVLNNSLITAHSHLTLQETHSQPELWGRLVESAVGAHLVNSFSTVGPKIFYWREGNYEVDFIIQKGKFLIAVEVKSGKRKPNLAGLDLFSEKFKVNKKILVGADGISVEDFLSTNPSELLE